MNCFDHELTSRAATLFRAQRPVAGQRSASPTCQPRLPAFPPTGACAYRRRRRMASRPAANWQLRGSTGLLWGNGEYEHRGMVAEAIILAVERMLSVAHRAFGLYCVMVSLPPRPTSQLDRDGQRILGSAQCPVASSCSPMSLASLAVVELQLTMQWLDCPSLLALARCSRSLLAAASHPFAWKHAAVVDLCFGGSEPPRRSPFVQVLRAAVDWAAASIRAATSSGKPSASATPFSTPLTMARSYNSSLLRFGRCRVRWLASSGTAAECARRWPRWPPCRASSS